MEWGRAAVSSERLPLVVTRGDTGREVAGVSGTKVLAVCAVGGCGGACAEWVWQQLGQRSRVGALQCTRRRVWAQGRSRRPRGGWGSLSVRRCGTGRRTRRRTRRAGPDLRPSPGSTRSGSGTAPSAASGRDPRRTRQLPARGARRRRGVGAEGHGAWPGRERSALSGQAAVLQALVPGPVCAAAPAQREPDDHPDDPPRRHHHGDGQGDGN